MQVQQRIIQKYGWKRPILFSVIQLEKRILKGVSVGCSRTSDLEIVDKTGSGCLGVDESGRSICVLVRKYATLLVERGVRLHTLIVLGSRAKNRSRPESDVDVMIIASELPGRSSPEFPNIPKRILNIRRSLLLSDMPLSAGIQPSACCSRQEFLGWLREFNVSALDALCYGKVLYDDGFWKSAIITFRELEMKYEINDNNLKGLLLPL